MQSQVILSHGIESHFLLHNMVIIACRVIVKPRDIAGEGDGTPLQYSCLENPRDRGAW